MPLSPLRVITVIALLALLLPAAGHAVTSSEVEAELMCDCGCGDVLVNCTCDRSEEMRAIINGMIRQGKSRTEILGIFVSQFGEVILASPRKEGFNLLAYGAPMAALAVGSVVAVSLARRWRSSRREEEEEEKGAQDEGLDDGMQEKIDRELDKLED
ncbi:MAG: cytochrome c-type biogenesis protein CcmH [bacterium]|nr:MAG: cytochrome c-type biogenesis protein CcmH [bacterium]